LLLHRRVKASY